MTDQSTSTAIERVEAQDLQERKRLNRLLAQADVMAASSLLRDDFRKKPENTRVAALTLDQLGVPVTINNMNACYVIKGAVGMMTWLWCAVAGSIGGHEIWLDESSNAERGIAHLRRAGTGVTRTVTFTIEDARRAGLLTGDNKHTYEKWTTDMLGWRALSRVVKRYAPEVMAGLAGAGVHPMPVGEVRGEYLAVEDPDDEVVDAEIIGEGPPAHMDSETGEVGHATMAPPGPAPDDEQDEVYAYRCRWANHSMGQVGVRSDDVRHALVREATGGSTESTGRLKAWQLDAIIDRCDRLKAADQEPEGGRENVGSVVGSAAPAPPGPVPGEWRARAAEQGISETHLLNKARTFAKVRGASQPETLDDVTDPGVVEDLEEWIG